MLEIARKMDVDPAKIAIEVTESVFSSECDKINRALENLKSRASDFHRRLWYRVLVFGTNS